MATGDVWRLSCIGDHGGTEMAIITLHVRMTSEVGTFPGAALIVHDDLLATLKTWQSPLFAWKQINGITVNTSPKISAEYTTGFPQTGEAVGQHELPHQVAQVCTLKTAYAGRSYRGRVFLPGFTEAVQEDGFWTAGHVTNVQTQFNTLIGHIGSAGSSNDYRLVVWSKRLNTSTNVSQVVVRNNPAVIRRRRIGVGQ